VADSRILHRKAGGSEKVAALSDFEYRVWTQYILSADDFGVMLAQAEVFKAESRSLRHKGRTMKMVQKAIDALVATGLVRTFEHQGETYLWQPDWQEWQGIRYPRATVMPAPKDLREATPKTRELFAKHSAQSPQDFGNPSETFPPHAGAHAGGRETPTHTQPQTQTHTRTPGGDPHEPPRSHPHGKPLIDGPSQRRHGQHARCYEARGLCMTPWIWEELCAKWGGEPGPARDADVRVWADAKVAATGTSRIGESPDAWWRKQMAADFAIGTPTGKGTRTTAAAQQVADALSSGAVLDPWHTTEALARRDAQLAKTSPGRGES